MKKEDISFVVSILRKTLQERRKMTIKDAEQITERLNLLGDVDIFEYKMEIDKHIRSKIVYFYRKNNREKVEEYAKIRKRNIAFFEFFGANRNKFIKNAQ